MLRLDVAGNVVWDNTYGGAKERDSARSIVALADGGFAVAGYTYSKGAGYDDMLVLRLDEAGNVVPLSKGWKRMVQPVGHVGAAPGRNRQR